ncbi:MAG: hypothetical protein KBT19_00365 [Lachnospiraceae bacterium]|nr:hypothetical protein [Candidatus Colinaster equi]
MSRRRKWLSTLLIVVLLVLSVTCDGTVTYATTIPVSETESESEYESVTETQSETDSETESETEPESESETESTSETKTESESETETMTEFDEPPLTYRDMCEEPDVSLLAKQSNVPLLRMNSASRYGFMAASPVGDGALPSSYSSVEQGYIPAIRNQGIYGTCWAHMAISLAEIYMIKNCGWSADTTDLSERQLVYCMYNYKGMNDPIGNTRFDYDEVNATGMGIYDVGGNINVTTWMLADWIGPISEVDAPYSSGGNMAALSKNSFFSQDVLHMTDCRLISPTQTDVMKHYIMSNGAVGASMYYSSSSYYNSATGAYYDNGYTGGANHGITIVGWDDDYSADNFKVNPGTNGAWLVRNSYGPGRNLDGYFWMSYANNCIKDVCAMMFEEADDYDNNYFYDGSGASGYVNIKASGSIANIYRIKHKEETLKAVGFGIRTTDTAYSIQLYKNPTDENDPTTGTPLLATPATGMTTTAGYYSVNVSCDTEFAAGDNIAVVITLTPTSGTNMNIYAATNRDYGWIAECNNMNGSKTLACVNGVWTDTSTAATPYTPRIHMYTDGSENVIVPTPKPTNTDEYIQEIDNGDGADRHDEPDDGDDGDDTMTPVWNNPTPTPVLNNGMQGDTGVRNVAGNKKEKNINVNDIGEMLGGAIVGFDDAKTILRNMN